MLFFILETLEVFFDGVKDIFKNQIARTRYIEVSSMRKINVTENLYAPIKNDHSSLKTIFRGQKKLPNAVEKWQISFCF